MNCALSENRLDRLEEGLSIVDKKIEMVSTHDSEQFELLAKLDTMVEFMVKDRDEVREERNNEKRIREEERRESREINKSITEAIQNVNENLISLNTDTDNIKSRVGVLEDNSSKYKIDTPLLITKAISTLITTGIVGGVIWLLSIYFSSK